MNGRDDGGRFQTGSTGGPGRPKGSRNKLGEEFVSAMYADFLEHGVTTIERMRETDPVAYVRMIASMLPKEVKITDERELTDDELDERIKQLASFLDLKIEPVS